MLAEAAIPQYALGLSEVSPALSFKISLREDGSVADTEIFPSLVRVRRMTYDEADRFLADPAASTPGGLLECGPDPAAPEAASTPGGLLGSGPNTASTPGGLPGNGPNTAIPEADLRRDLAALRRLGEANLARRIGAGAVVIELPEVFIHVAGEVSIEPVLDSPAAALVRECMLLAGEGAAHWALQRRLPFPFVTQELGDLPRSPLPGMAGSYQLRRSMRPRALSAKPGRHAGLGLEAYTQVTSPLRRYTDLLAHQQIRAFLRGAADHPPLDEEAVLFALAAGEAAASATVQAERASRAYWTAVYLSGKTGSSWEGFVMEQKGPRTVFLIPALALETQVPVKGDLEPNQAVTLTLASVNIPGAEAVFTV
jgi:exoribonuclease-2